MATSDFQLLQLGPDLELFLCRRCGGVVASTDFINGREIHDDRFHTDDEADDLRGWTPEEMTEWQRRAGIVFQTFVGQNLTELTMRRFKEAMLEEGIPAETVGITSVDGQPQLTVVFEHKPR